MRIAMENVNASITHVPDLAILQGDMIAAGNFDAAALRTFNREPNKVDVGRSVE